jgi:hypothetical protein
MWAGQAGWQRVVDVKIGNFSTLRLMISNKYGLKRHNLVVNALLTYLPVAANNVCQKRMSI